LDIQDILKRWGCTVVGPVATATEALALIADECPDLAILDVHLNGETSEPIAVALQASGRPFLVMTAYPRSHVTGALSVAPLLSKPVDEKKLAQELSTLVADARS
jgi:CheY-like chemotaxis protein